MTVTYSFKLLDTKSKVVTLEQNEQHHDLVRHVLATYLGFAEHEGDVILAMVRDYKFLALRAQSDTGLEIHIELVEQEVKAPEPLYGLIIWETVTKVPYLNRDNLVLSDFQDEIVDQTRITNEELEAFMRALMISGNLTMDYSLNSDDRFTLRAYLQTPTV